MRLFDTPITKKIETFEAPKMEVSLGRSSAATLAHCCRRSLKIHIEIKRKLFTFIKKKQNRVGKVSLLLAKINCLIIPNLCSLESKDLSRDILRRLKISQGISSRCHFLQACDLSSTA
jgi:hypothetical protein